MTLWYTKVVTSKALLQQPLPVAKQYLPYQQVCGEERAALLTTAASPHGMNLLPTYYIRFC